MALDIAIGFYGIGAFFLLVGSFWIIAIASKDATGWKYTVAFIPLLNIVYALFRWEKCKIPFVIFMVGLALLLIGVVIMLNVEPVAIPAPEGE